MKRLSLIFLGLLLLLGCRRDPLSSRDYSLNVSIFVQGASVSTKAGEEEDYVDATEEERTIHSLQIWVFQQGTNTLLAYFEPNTSEYNFQGGQVIRLQASIAEDVARAKPNVDIFALANGAAVQAGLTQDTPRATLEGLVLNGDQFGTGTLCEAVPTEGLPLSGQLLNTPMEGAFPVMKIASVVELTRLVSKIRFLFCQLAEADGTLTGDYAVTSISLNGEIGATEKVFTNEVYSPSAGRLETNIFDITGTSALSRTWTGTDLPQTIAPNTAPADYLYENSSAAQDYDTQLDNGVRRGDLTEWKRLYLRESGSAFTGEIRYTVNGGAEKTAAFSLPAGLFTRNHYWVVYAYFLGGKLYVKPTVLPWIAGIDRYNYKTEGSTEFRYEKPWLRYDVDKKANSWNDTWLVVAYGYEGGDSGKPTHSPMFTLETDNRNDLTLQINNDHFVIVQMVESTDGEGNPVIAYTKHGQSLSITGSSEKQTTNFYIVPVSDAVMQDPYVKVFLTEIHSGDGLPPQNIPFNHNLPGDEDHTSILIYNPGRAEYVANMNNHKASSNEQPTQYWLEEEG